MTPTAPRTRGDPGRKIEEIERGTRCTLRRRRRTTETDAEMSETGPGRDRGRDPERGIGERDLCQLEMGGEDVEMLNRILHCFCYCE